MLDALTISGLDCFYGEVQVLHGLSLDARQRRGALPARPQRRRQDDDAEGDHGAGAGRAPARSGSTARDLTGLPAHEVPKAGVAYVPQGRRLFAELTVAENLEIGLMARGKGKADARARARPFPAAARAAAASAPARSPAASSRCWPWRARSASSRRCCCSTSRPRA